MAYQAVEAASVPYDEEGGAPVRYQGIYVVLPRVDATRGAHPRCLCCLALSFALLR